jgi:hypothetical protein
MGGMSDSVQIAGMVLTFLGTALSAVIAYLIARLTRGQTAAAVEVRAAAVEVRQVKRTLDQTTAVQSRQLGDLADVAAATHVLVNNNMAVQLKLNAELSRWKAEQTRDPADARAAEAAERLYREHEVKQAAVDRAAPGGGGT